MSVISSITTAIRNNAGKYLIKGVGLGALGLVAYDAHYIGKLESDIYATEKDGKSAGKYLNNAMYSNNMSPIEDKVRDFSLKMELDQSYKRFFNSIIGYVKGFVGMLIEHVVPLGLGLGALLSKGKFAKISAAGLGVYSIYEILKNFFGWGTPKGLP